MKAKNNPSSNNVENDDGDTNGEVKGSSDADIENHSPNVADGQEKKSTGRESTTTPENTSNSKQTCTLYNIILYFFAFLGMASMALVVIYVQIESKGDFEDDPYGLIMRSIISAFNMTRNAIDKVKNFEKKSMTGNEYSLSILNSLPPEIAEVIFSVLYQEMPVSPLVILLIGKTGVGKSTAGNAILGKTAFKSGLSARPITQRTEIAETFRFDKKLIVVDTPGVQDTDSTNEEVLMEISRCYALTSPGFHAIVLVSQIERFTKEDEDTLQFFVDRFGEDLYQYLIIVFTGKDNLEREGQTIEDYIKTLEERSGLRQLLKKTMNRYTAFGLYKVGDQRQDHEIKTLISMVHNISNNGKHHFTNDMYKRAESNYQSRLEKEMENIRQEKAREVEDFINEVFKQSEVNEDIQMAVFKEVLANKMRTFEKEFREKTMENVLSNDSWLLKRIHMNNDTNR